MQHMFQEYRTWNKMLVMLNTCGEQHVKYQTFQCCPLTYCKWNNKWDKPKRSNIVNSALA